MPPIPTEEDLMPTNPPVSEPLPPTAAAATDAAEPPAALTAHDHAELRNEIHNLRTDVQRSTAALKRSFVVTGVATALAIVFGVAGFNTALLSGMSGSFQAGHTQGKVMAELSAELEQTRDALAAKTASGSVPLKAAEKPHPPEPVKPAESPKPVEKPKQAALADCSALPADAKAEVIEFPIQFQSGIAKISTASEPTLDSIAKLLALASERCVVVEGHTDATGTPEKNMALSRERAGSVVKHLVEKGGIERRRLVSVGKGSGSPLPDIDPTDSKNRRIVFKIFAD